MLVASEREAGLSTRRASQGEFMTSLGQELLVYIFALILTSN